MSSASPLDPLAVVQTAAAAPRLEGEPLVSQTAHRLRNVENTTAPADTPSPSTQAQAPSSAPAAGTSSDMPGPITEEAFARISPPNGMPTATGGPLIATETTSAMISAKLENGEPVLTLRIAPIVTPTATAVETTSPDDAVEPTVISAPPSEQALATPAIAVTHAPEPAAEPVAAPPVEPAHPRAKPAIHTPARAPAPVHHAKPRTPARVTTTSAPARQADEDEDEEETTPPAPDPLNAPYVPSATPALGDEEPMPAPATGAPASTTPPPTQGPPTGGPTPLTMPQ
ncbi:MAG: hypothetical protein GC190_01940 [Alphaproteobacteria bacterium]|nr:hypothetical protein [Alphaproteobacteria bacterium]